VRQTRTVRGLLISSALYPETPLRTSIKWAKPQDLDPDTKIHFALLNRQTVSAYLPQYYSHQHSALLDTW
jgi:hypothetical protein